MRFDFERDINNQYIVKKGDSLYKIAKDYNVTVQELIDTNKLTTTLIYPNQVLIIPLKTNGDVYFVEYVVKENDTLQLIADKYNITINDLMNYNSLEKLYLVNDQVLTIPQRTKRHEVVATDTIDYLLRKYNMTLEEFIDLNKDKLLVIGTYLNVK